MNLLKAFYCRAFQTVFRLALPFLPYREPKILHDCGELGQAVCAKRLKKVLIVTDAGIVRNGLTEPVEAALQENGVVYVRYDQTEANPTVQNVEQALACYHQNGCEGLIAVGGGSSMDCAKAVGARVVYPRRTVGQMKGILRVLRPLPLLIAVPTTAGTGSETTLAAVIKDPERQHKYALMSFPLIPHYAVLDASLTVSLPPSLTAQTGMDALTHAVEAYLGRSTTRQTRTLALEAVQLIFANLETAYRDGSNTAARKAMLLAAYKAGAAFSKSYVGYVHAIAHSLGGQYGTPHGLANAVILPYVLEAYGETVHRKLHQLGVAAGICAEEEPDALAAARFIAAIRAMNARMDIPEKLPGIRRAEIPELARRAEREANPLYPVPKLMTAEELEYFYHKIADWSSSYDKAADRSVA